MNLRSPAMRLTGRRFPASLAASWFLPFSLTANMILSSRTQTNGSAFFDYAAVIFSAVLGVLISGIGNYLCPGLAETASDEAAFSAKAAASLKTALAVSLPVSLLLSLLAGEITELLYLRGDFAASDAALVGEILSAMAIALPFCTVNEILKRIFEASGKSRFAVYSTLSGGAAILVFSVVPHHFESGMLNNSLILAFGHGIAAAVGLILWLTKLPEKSSLPDLFPVLLGGTALCIVSALVYQRFSAAGLVLTSHKILCILSVYLCGMSYYLPF